MSLISKKEIALKNKIYAIRGLQVMLDRDLAELYEVPTKVLNQAVKRNIERFPNDFMFQLTKNELENLKFQNGTSSDDSSMSQNVTLETKQDLRSQIVTSKYGWGGTRKLSYVFTEQGVATLSGVLKSKKAI